MNYKNVIYILIVMIALTNMAIADPTQHKPRISEKYGTSTNWAGYAVTQNLVTDVQGSWIVPAVTCQKSKTTYSSFWVGIDGYNSGTVEQIGTDSDCFSGKPVYYSWYEFYPAYPVNNIIPVKVGDVMSAEVSYIGNNQFSVTLTDVTTGATFNTVGTVSNAQRSSAEWIVEAPWMGRVLPLANFGLAKLGLDYTGIVNTNYATINGGVSSNIGSFESSVQSITMVNNFGQVKAQPSVLTPDGTSFTTQWIRSN